MPDENKRETGDRKLQSEPNFRRENPVHTGDRGDEPKKPYGLTESMNDRGGATRHYDGVQPSRKRETAAQFAGTQHRSDNDGTTSAEPRVMSKNGDGDATFPLHQGKA